jgi:hypothetical protein
MDRQRCADTAMMFANQYARMGPADQKAQPTVEHVEVRASNVDEANRIRDQLQHDRSARPPARDNFLEKLLE